MIRSAAEQPRQPSRPGTSVFVPECVVRATEGGHAALVLAWLVVALCSWQYESSVKE